MSRCGRRVLAQLLDHRMQFVELPGDLPAEVVTIARAIVFRQIDACGISMRCIRAVSVGR